MSIPKRLILYRAPRHQESLPANIKQGYYSHKISLSPLPPNKKSRINSHRRYQKKFSQEISFQSHERALAVLPRFSHAVKCKIEPADEVFRRRPIQSMMKIFKRAFRILKGVKKLTIGTSGKPQNKGSVSKTLLLSKNLESLTLLSFSYAEDSEAPMLFIEAAKSAEKRKSWPYLKSINIQLQPPELSMFDPDENLFTRSLELLLGFVKDLKSCEKIYNCLSFELKASPESSINSEQLSLLTQIVKAVPLITSLQDCEASHFSISNLVQPSMSLKKVGLSLYGILLTDFNLKELNKMPNFQELALQAVSFEEWLSTEIVALKNLAVLSIKFQTMRELPLVARMITDLPNLKSLELDFSNQPLKARNLPSVLEVFQAIGKKSRLEKLSLSFSNFNFENSELAFDDLCQNLENLLDLSYLKLEITYVTDTLRLEEISRFGQCLNRLPRIQELALRLTKSSCLNTRTFCALVDSIVKGLPILSRLWLKIGKVEVDDEFCQLLSREMNKMKCLNWVLLHFEGGETKSDVGLRGLAAEIRKKIVGGVEYLDPDRFNFFNF